MFFLFFGFFCEPALTFPKTIDKPSKSMVSHKTIHSMAMVRLEKTIGKTIDTNGWNLKNHWKTIGTNGSHVKNHWKTIDYNGILRKTINHSIVVKFLPSFRSNGILCGIDIVKHKCRPKCIIIFFGPTNTIAKKITVIHRLFPLTGLVEAWGLCGAWNKREWVFSNYRRFLL